MISVKKRSALNAKVIKESV